MNRKIVYCLRTTLLMSLCLLSVGAPVQAETASPIPVDSVSDPQTTGYPDSRKLVRDSKGNLYLAYRKKGDDGAQHIFVARLPEGNSTFTNTDESIETKLIPYTQRVPSLAIDEDNTLHVVWYGPDANSAGVNDRQIRYTRSQRISDGEISWAPVIAPAGIITGFAAISPSPTLWQEHPVIFAAPNQMLYVAWEGKDSAHPQKAQVKWIRSDDGGTTWSAWQNIPGDAKLYYSRPTILATGDGRKLYLLAYATAPNGTAQVVWTQSLDNDDDPGDVWDAWRYAMDANNDDRDRTQDQRHLSAILDSKEQLHLVWRQKPEGAPATAKTQIHYATYLQNGHWSLAIPLMPNPQVNQSFPSLTVDKDDRLWAAWSESPELPQFPSEEPVTGEIRAAKKPKQQHWQPIQTPIVSSGANALYPTLGWRRYGSKYGVDLAWVETTASTSANTLCMEEGKVTCIIYMMNLAGQ